MKLIVAGSRSIDSYVVVERAIRRVSERHSLVEIVSGAARGVDTLGERWAKANGVLIKRFPAEWDKHGRKAGMLRNAEMAQYADGLLAVWDGVSLGTKNMIETMRRLDKYVAVWTHKVR
jgi:hypothetical protein